MLRPYQGLTQSRSGKTAMRDRGGRYCVVTPYFKEDRAMLKRCMDSVRRQTAKVDHMLVADGFPQDWISTEPGAT
jgi:hypothetical protein